MIFLNGVLFFGGVYYEIFLEETCLRIVEQRWYTHPEEVMLLVRYWWLLYVGGSEHI